MPAFSFPPDDGPHLELVWATSTDLELGARWPLIAARTTIGRGKSCAVRLAVPSLALTAAHLAREEGGFRVVDHGAAAQTREGIRVAGTRVSQAVLHHGDVFELPSAWLRLTEHSESALPEKADPLIEALRAAPDEAKWLVFGDWLAEHQHPLGAWVVQGSPPTTAEAATWLGPLGTALKFGALKVTWRHGVVEHLTLAASAGPAVVSWVVRRLATLPQGAFLKGVELATISNRETLADERIAAVLQAIASLDPRLPLEQVRLEGVQPAALTAAERGPWALIRKRFPRVSAKWPLS